MTDKRKTISGEDVLYSIHLLGYEKFLVVLNLYLERFWKVTKIEEPHKEE